MITMRFWMWLGIVLSPCFLLPCVPAFHPGCVPDDSYYYYTVARNLWSCGFLTLDGQTQASGYHPLFMSLCVALARMAPNSLPYVVPVVACASFWIYVVLCARIARLLELGRNETILFALMTVANPAVLINGWVVGLETVLAIPLLAAFLYVCLGAVIREATARRFRIAVVLTCALFLARLDTLVFAFPVLLFVFRQRLRNQPFCTAAPATVVIAFMACHWLVFGTPYPSSTDSIRFLMRPLYEQQLYAWSHTGTYWDFPAHFGRFVMNLGKAGRSMAGLPTWTLEPVWPNRLLGSLLLVGFLVYGARLVIRSRSSRWDRRRIVFSVVCIGVLSVLVYIGTIRIFYLREWYYAMYAVIAGIAAWSLVSAAPDRPAMKTSALCLYALMLLIVTTVWILGGKPQPLHRMEVASQAVRMAAPSRIGAFNAGYYAWAEPGKIINLDGLGNQQAYEAIRKGELAAYLERNGIRYLLDIDPVDVMETYLNPHRRANQPPSLEPIRSWPDGAYVHTLYAVRPPAQASTRRGEAPQEVNP